MKKYINSERKPQTITNPGDEMISSTKQLGLFLVGWAGFQFIGSLFSYLFAFIFSRKLGITSNEALARLDVSMSINAGTYLVLIIFLLLILFKDLQILCQSFKKYQAYIAGFVCLIAIFAFNFCYNIFLSTVKTPIQDNVNQAGLMSLEDKYPILAFIIFGIIGPICEELAYRVGLFSFFKKKSRVLAYIATIIIFALIHFNYSDKYLMNEILNLPFYAFAAFAFSYTYDKYGLAGSLTAHILNNVISLAAVSLIL